MLSDIPKGQRHSRNVKLEKAPNVELSDWYKTGERPKVVVKENEPCSAVAIGQVSASNVEGLSLRREGWDLCDILHAKNV